MQSGSPSRRAREFQSQGEVTPAAVGGASASEAAAGDGKSAAGSAAAGSKVVRRNSADSRGSSDAGDVGSRPVHGVAHVAEPVTVDDATGATHVGVPDPDGSGRIYYGPQRFDPDTGMLLVNWLGDYAPTEPEEDSSTASGAGSRLPSSSSTVPTVAPVSYGAAHRPEAPQALRTETETPCVNFRAENASAPTEAFCPSNAPTEPFCPSIDASQGSGFASHLSVSNTPMDSDNERRSADREDSEMQNVDEPGGVYLGPRRFYPGTDVLIPNWREDYEDVEPSSNQGASSSISAPTGNSAGPSSAVGQNDPRRSTESGDHESEARRSSSSRNDGSREKEEPQQSMNVSCAENCSDCACKSTSRPRPNVTLTREELMAKVREINADSSLSNEEKDARRQALFSAPFDERKRQAAVVALRESSASVKTYSNVTDPETNNPMLGCKHYPRKCKIKAACCGEFFGCRLCHDEVADHKIDRFATETVICMECKVEQPVAESCATEGCGVGKFARYYCPTCKFYDDTPGKDIYHCADCGICRVGKGLGIDNFHCHKCDACISMSSKDSHKCLAKSLHSDCPICHEYLFTSTKPVVYMVCGHTMHSHCFDEYTQKYYACPICKRALTDMQAYYRQIDVIMEQNDRASQMPAEYAKRRSRILCNDCSARTVTTYDFTYHKCQECGSYNTQVLETFDANEDDHEEPVEAMDEDVAAEEAEDAVESMEEEPAGAEWEGDSGSSSPSGRGAEEGGSGAGDFISDVNRGVT